LWGGLVGGGCGCFVWGGGGGGGWGSLACLDFMELPPR